MNYTLAASVFCGIFILWLLYTHYFRPYFTVKSRTRLHGPSPRIYSGNYSDISELGYLKCIPQWMSQYGPTFICYFGIKPVIMTEDLEIIKSVIVKNFDSFINRPYLPALITKGEAQGILRLRGDQWRRARRILTPTFSSKKLRMMSPLIQESCERLRNKMAAVSDTDSSVDVREWFGKFTMEVILATAFSRDVSSDNDKESPLIGAAASVFQSLVSGNTLDSEKLMTILSHFPWSVPFLRLLARRSKFAQSYDYLEETALKLIQDRRNTMATTGSTARDLLQLMLEAHDENAETSSSGYLSNDEIVAEIVTFMLAGYETTSNALSYATYLLALNPTIQDRLIREINEYYDVNPDSSLYDAAESIEYVTMVLYESLRMYPPAPRISRECNQTCAVTDELIVEKGINVSVPVFSLHRNPEYWPNPDKFDPDRFNPNSEHSYPMFAFLPFGEGPRNCIGKRLALLEAKMTLVAIFKELYFKRTADTEVPLDLSFGFTISPKKGVKLSILSNGRF